MDDLSHTIMSVHTIDISVISIGTDKTTRPPPTLKRIMLQFAVCINRCRCVFVFILIKIIPRQKSNARDFSSNIMSAFPFVDHKRQCENTPSTLQNRECSEDARRAAAIFRLPTGCYYFTFKYLMRHLAI